MVATSTKYLLHASQDSAGKTALVMLGLTTVRALRLGLRGLASRKDRGSKSTDNLRGIPAASKHATAPVGAPVRASVRTSVRAPVRAPVRTAAEELACEACEGVRAVATAVGTAATTTRSSDLAEKCVHRRTTDAPI